MWATSAGFSVEPKEMQEVVAAYKDKGTDGVKQVQSTGLHIAGERFVVLKADDRSIYGKKVSSPANRGGVDKGSQRIERGRSWSERDKRANDMALRRAEKASLSSRPPRPCSSHTTRRPCSRARRPTRSSSWRIT